MSSQGIRVEVLIATDDELLGKSRLSELTSLIEPITLATIAEPIEAIVRLVSMARFDIGQLPSSDCTRTGIILISSHFLDGPQDARHASVLAKQLVVASMKTAAPIGLIAVTGPPVRVHERPPIGIDWVVSTTDANFTAALRDAIKQVAFRLWYKVPPLPPKAGSTTADSIVLDYVRSAAELEQTFKLRYEVYDLLGYLEETIRSSGSLIDVDAFDRDAIHLVARETRSKKVVGCMRLILPSRNVNRLFEENIHCPDSVAQWCDELAAREKSKVVRKRLQNGTFLQLPAASMEQCGRLTRDMHTKDYCELSRLIVSPGYRGLHLSSRLLEMAIQLVTCLNRKIMLVECVPSHRRLYESFGFKLGDEDRDGPAAAHQLRTQAITLSLNLSEQSIKPKTKANLLIAMSSREIAPDALRKLTGQLRRDLPLELWSPDCRAMLPSNETKRMDPSESSLSVHVMGRGHASELAQAIARLLAESRGLSVRVRERDAGCEFHASGDQSPDSKSILNSILQLLQWTDPTISNAQS